MAQTINMLSGSTRGFGLRQHLLLFHTDKSQNGLTTTYRDVAIRNGKKTQLLQFTVTGNSEFALQPSEPPDDCFKFALRKMVAGGL
jgi:hypothetical protein